MQKEDLVYVINKSGNPLMPCKQAKARHLIKAGKVKIVNYTPFTIQLKWDCEGNTQPATLGIDKGAKFTGVTVVNDETGETLFQAEIHHRADVKLKMESRRNNRKARRNLMWYRPRRFNNRSSSRREGRLPQSIKTNADEVLRVVRKLPLPISRIIVEDVLVDIRKLTNPEVRGKQYHESNRLEENLRLACLMRDNFKCQSPNRIHTRQLHAHHIVERSKSGKDTITNLITLCKECHGNLHSGKWKLGVTGASGFQDRIAQRTMQGKNYLYRELRKLVPDLKLIYGYQTAERRHELGLEKTHVIDGFIIAGGVTYSDNNCYSVNFRPRQTRRRFHDLPQKGKGRVRYQVNEELGGFRKGDVVLVQYKGHSYVKQINSILSETKRGDASRLSFKRVVGEPASILPKNCVLLERKKTIVFNRFVAGG